MTHVPQVPSTPRALSPEGRSAALADLLRQATQASLDPDAVLEVAVRWCARVLGDRAGVWTLDHGRETLEIGPHAHAREETGGSDAPRLDGALAERAIERHTAVADGGRMLAPLRSRGRVLGILAVEHADPDRAFRREDLSLLGEVAARVGLVLDNARLYERVRVQATTLEHVDAAVCAVDAEGRITSFNPAAERMFGYDEAEVLGRSPLELLSAEPPPRVAEARAAVVAHGRHASPWRLRRKGGELFDGHIHTVAVEADGDGGGMKGMVAVYQDLSERLALIAALERQAAQQAAVAALGERALEAEHPSALVDRAVEMVRQTLQVELVALFELVDEGRMLALGAGAGFPDNYVGHATVPAGWSDGQEGFTLIRREPVIVDDARRERRFVQASLVGDLGAISGVSVVVGGHARTHAVLAAYAARPGAFTDDDVTFLQSMANVLGDALDRFAGEEEIRHRGLHDPLTELPNRTLVLERLGQAVARADPERGRVALLFLDLDHFKNVNDSLGHRAGDDVLRQVADRLRATVRPVDTVGRFGGDEFVVLCEDVADEAMARAIAERVADAFAPPFRAGGDDHVLGASIGVALMDTGRDAVVDPDALLRDADAAMYRAKEAGRARIEVFDMGMRAWAVDRLATEAALRRALEADDELVVHYQPVVDLRDGSIAAVEALVRWRHPERGLLGPDAFVGVAEDSGLIVGLGQRVLELASAQAAAWAAARGEDRPVLPVHVNLSPRQLLDPALVETVQAALGDLVPGALALEITEGTLIDRGVDRVALLERLRDLGVTLVLDDFGTGWSSLARLAELPIGGLKVDRSFVADIDDRGGPIVDAVVRLARAFDLPVVAEGIETARQLDVLADLDCGLGQGFLFARALPAEELTALLVADAPPYGAIVSRRPRSAAADRA